MPQSELLVGSAAFWKRLSADIAAARRRLLVQAMTFEGDAAGLAVCDAILESQAEDRRVLVDDYTRHVQSDRFIHPPFALLDAGLKSEVKATRAMFAGLRAAGVGVRVTNPAGALLHGFAARNHKKLMVCDDAAYIGGVNFSEHNFEWQDLMLRIDDPAAADFLAEDFEATYVGRSRPAAADFGGLRLISLDGRSNGRGFREVIRLLDGARTSIAVVSPYLTFPFVAPLARAVARGVPVELHTPLDNNKTLVRDYLLDAARHAGLAIYLSPAMTHLKGMLVDGQALVLGSSNFDVVSYHCEEEVIAICREPALSEAFSRRVLQPSRKVAIPPGEWQQPSRAQVIAAQIGLGAAAAVARLSRNFQRRAIDWPDNR